jgi:hypothetical protein
VGFIDATGRDLDRVVVKGDLSKIVAGDSITANDPGLNLLRVRSMGTLGLVTQGGSGDLASTIAGKLGALKVAGDFTDALLRVIGGVDGLNGQIGSIFIGGGVTGGAGNDSGQIISFGAMGDVRVGGNVTGGEGNNSGHIFGISAMGDVRIGGDVIGGAGLGSGLIGTSGGMGKVRVGGNVTGAGDSSGQIACSGVMGNVSVGHGVIGGSGSSSGRIFSGGAMGHVRIAGDLIGGSIAGTASLADSGLIISGERIASVTLGGSLIAGTDASTGTLTRCGAIVAGDDLGPVKIGSILGNSTNPALISAVGQAENPTSGFDTTIASLTVKGDVRFAQILAGFDSAKTPINFDAAIGAVNVGRDWVASSLVAGANNLGADDALGGTGLNADNVNFGDVHDKLQTGDDSLFIARIASITIKGTVRGSLSSGDHFGFVAQQIGKLTIGGRAVPLTEGKDDLPLPFANDVRVHEVS